jgi:hypothetical protein
MTKDEYDKFSAMEDWQLLGFSGDHDNSSRKASMMHILEMRRTQKAALAAEKSAVAAKWAAVAAFLSVIVAVVALFRK